MAIKAGCFHKNERLAWFQWGMCIICTAYVHKRKTAVYLTAGCSAWLQVTRLLSQDGRRMFTLTLFTPVVGNLFHTTDGCQGEESIWMWLTARALFVCVRSHATIVELSIWVLSKICVMFQLQPHLALDAGKGDDHHGLSSGPRESICYPTSWCWGQGAVLNTYAI